MASEIKYALLESAAGFALFERKEGDEVSSKLAEMQKLVLDFTRFARCAARANRRVVGAHADRPCSRVGRRVMNLLAFLPFKTAEDALENVMAIAEGSLSASLQAFLQANLPAKAKKVAMGVSAHNLGSIIQESLGISCACNDYTAELLRGLRVHLPRFVPALRPGDLERAQLGLAHSYSRTKARTPTRHSPAPPLPASPLRAPFRAAICPRRHLPAPPSARAASGRITSGRAASAYAPGLSLPLRPRTPTAHRAHPSRTTHTHRAPHRTRVRHACQVKFDVNRADKHIIQAIAILDTLDKDINTFAMRVREWYSWHFPELVKIVPDNCEHAEPHP
jgi:hypothetical protein